MMENRNLLDLGRGAELVCEPFECTIKSDDR